MTGAVTFDPTIHGDRMAGRYQGQQGAQMVGPETPSWVQFYKGSRLNAHKSKEQGVPIYDAVDFMKVYHPGEPSNIYNQPVRDQDKFVYRKQWEAYESGRADDVTGTPLNVLFPNNPELVSHLQALRIMSVQQLAGLTDTGLQQVQFGMELKNKARAYLDVAEKGKEFHAQNTKIEEQQLQINELTAKINELVGAQLLAAPAPKKRGRPPKSAAAPTGEAA